MKCYTRSAFVKSFCKAVFLCVLVVLWVESAFSQSVLISGTVQDSATREPLAFVSIVFPDGKNGVQTDIDGKFRISSDKPVGMLSFHYVGYRKLSLDPEGKEKLEVLLVRQEIMLKEVAIRAGENPAHRIIRKVSENREKNDPEALPSFRYHSYNKFYFTTDKNDTLKRSTPVKKPAENDSIALKRREDLRKTDSMLNTQHLFLTESVTERTYLFPGRNKEEIISSKVSGLKKADFVLMASQFQSFSFYKDHIKVADKDYLSPLSKGSTSSYFFNMEDTLLSGSDTIFIISFRPRQGKNFDGMKGVLYVHTDGYALQNVLASPADSTGFSVSVQQLYEKVEGKYWFPSQLNADIRFGNMYANNRRLIGSGSTYIRDVEVGMPVKKKEFNEIELSFGTKEKTEQEQALKAYRQDTLSQKEERTYQVLDSIGEKYHWDRKIAVFESISRGYIPVKFIDVDLKRALVYNKYEGFRPGIGGRTNTRISKYLSLGGYIAYGFKDKGYKWGTSGELMISREHDIKIFTNYREDVAESGAVLLYMDKKLPAEAYRNYLVSNMDFVDQQEAGVTFRTFHYFLVTLYGNQTLRTVTTPYRFSDDEMDRFHYRELGGAVRFAFREKFMMQPAGKISLGTAYPIVIAQVTRGYDLDPTSRFAYLKSDLKVLKSFRIRKAGKMHLALQGGWIHGIAPYPLAYNGKGSSGEDAFLLSVNCFETMGLNEFLSDRYASIFFTHQFGKLLYRSKRFQPEPAIHQHIGYGMLRSAAMHRNYAFKTMEKGYYESGVSVKNVLRLTGPGYTEGFGVAVFYRYGPYASPVPKENLFLKMVFSITL